MNNIVVSNYIIYYCGLYKHFEIGCPAGVRDISHLRWTLVDYMSSSTSTEQLDIAGHLGGAKCCFSECIKLNAQMEK